MEGGTEKEFSVTRAALSSCAKRFNINISPLMAHAPVFVFLLGLPNSTKQQLRLISRNNTL